MNNFDLVVTIDQKTKFAVKFGLGPLGIFEYLHLVENDPDTKISEIEDILKIHRAIDCVRGFLNRGKQISQSIDDIKKALPETKEWDFEHAILAVMRRKAAALRAYIPWERVA